MIPGHKHLIVEEGLQSAWLYETLNPNVDEIVVVGITAASHDILEVKRCSCNVLKPKAILGSPNPPPTAFR